jgi:hypothetical protein
MAIQTPPTISPTPTPTIQRGDRTTFSARVDAFILWLVNAVTQFNGSASATNANALDAQASAQLASTMADAAVSGVNATAWVSGTTYTAGQVRYSPLDSLTYRRKTNGAGTTDPSLDTVNWVRLSHKPESMLLLATIVPTVATTIDFLNVFTSEFDSYMVTMDGVTPNVTQSLQMRLAKAGVADASTVYYAGAEKGNVDTAVTLAQLTTVQVSAGGQGINLTALIRNANAPGNPSAGGLKSIEVRYVADTTGSPSRFQTEIRSFVYLDGAVSGFRLFWSAGGNFQANGRVRVYGLRNVV